MIGVAELTLNARATREPTPIFFAKSADSSSMATAGVWRDAASIGMWDIMENGLVDRSTITRDRASFSSPFVTSLIPNTSSGFSVLKDEDKMSQWKNWLRIDSSWVGTFWYSVRNGSLAGREEFGRGSFFGWFVGFRQNLFLLGRCYFEAWFFEFSAMKTDFWTHPHHNQSINQTNKPCIN